MNIQPAQSAAEYFQDQRQLVESIVIGGIYQHYKGDKYKVLAVSRHSEDLSWYVVYQALYDNPVSAIWHRPIEMFLGLVDLNGVATPRFRHVA